MGLDLGKVGALGAWVCYQVELVYSLDLCNKVSEVHSERGKFLEELKRGKELRKVVSELPRTN